MPDGFWRWLCVLRKRYAWIVLALPTTYGLATWLVTLYPRIASNPLAKHYGTTVLLSLQCLVAVALVLLLPPANVQARPGLLIPIEARDAARQFRFWWHGPWLAWILYYLVYAVLTAAGYPDALSPEHKAEMTCTLNVLNDLSTVLILICYRILATETTRLGFFEWGAWIILGIAGTCVVEIVLLTVMAGGGISATTLSSYQLISSGASGLAAGIALALLIGRLESKLFVGSGLLVIAVLYSYAMIQPLAILFERSKTAIVVLTSIALCLKCLLFAFVAWALETRRVLYYMKRIRELAAEVDKDWQDFLRDD